VTTKVINLFAGPGAGKSTTASGLFYKMKLMGLKVELVREYVKDMVYEERDILTDQLYIFGKQQRRQKILNGNVDWIVTDSPIILSAVYAPEVYYNSFQPLCLEVFNTYNNYNFFINRKKEYLQLGRTQTEQEARDIDYRVLDYLEDKNLKYVVVDGDEDVVDTILNKLNRHIYKDTI